MRANSFPSATTPATRVLVLGSMPGITSLEENQYYAHPRNAFWPIMAELANLDPAADYPTRLTLLNAAGIGLWDVYATCTREGSLDSAIENNTAEFNPIPELIRALPDLQLIACNGQTAHKMLLRLLKQENEKLDILIPPILCLPSTSPAYASKRFEEKLGEWKILGQHLPPQD